MLHEFTVLVDEADAEFLADNLLSAGALSVAIEDAQAGTEQERALFGEPGGEPQRTAWHKSRLVVLSDPGSQPAELLATACTQAWPQQQALPEIEAIRHVEDTDWVRLTQSQFNPVQVSDALWIVPSWHTPPESAQHVIRLDPGVAFGTGTHPTTRLCLQWLELHLQPGARVLDYGCGSGILSIAAAKFGARSVWGVDIDPHALEAARTNAAANLSESKLTSRYTTPDELPDNQPFDIVVANILANPLKILAPALCARVAQRGALVLAGILERQADEIIEVYQQADPAIHLGVWRSEDGWICMVGQRLG